ncbi:MAG: ribose-5-phosphate isomerase RpiA [Syntrophales bacterium]|jgi:ribose 5-phosphate isomerase A
MAERTSRVGSETSKLKEQAAHRAVEFVQSGMIVGLGHGSTALYAVKRIAELIHSGVLRNIRGVPCSRKVFEDARKLGIPLTTLNRNSVIDLAIDGADEVDGHLNLIKGGGGALLREKIVAQASLCEIIIVDEAKMSPVIGTRCAVPIEVAAFGWKSHIFPLEKLGAEVKPRRNSDGKLFKTDQGNIILDANFGPISDPAKLAADLKARAGFIEHGLFIGIATDVIVAGKGGLRHLERN